MAWDSDLPSAVGSKIMASDMGTWLNEVNSRATYLINNHCSSVYGQCTNYTSNYGQDSNCGYCSVADKNNDGAVDFKHTGSISKCGAEL